jgi:4-amino-4-deoxy-L-arabinose transferase-like glycosyltransferase
MEPTTSLVSPALPVASPAVQWPDRLAAALAVVSTRAYAVCALVLLLGAGFNTFYALDRTRIDDMDEARYGVSAYEMLQAHSYVLTTYAGRPETWNLKPPLGYWVLATSFQLLGPSVLALRLPSALCALATIALLMAFCRRRLGDTTALLAGAMLATCYGFYSHHGARSGDLDAPLTLLLTAVAVLVPELAASAWRWVVLWSLLAVGFLLKSFAIAPLVAAIAIWLLLTGEWRRIPRRAFFGGALLFAAVVGSWAAARWHADGSPYFLRMLVSDEVVARCLRQVDKGASHRIDYLPALFDRFAPWSELLVITGIAAAWAGGWRRLESTLRLGGRRLGLWLALWAGVPLLVFSLAKTHHHWYLDPVYPALAVLAARGVLSMIARAPRRDRAALVAVLVVVPLVLCETRIATRVLLRDRRPAEQRELLALGAERATIGPTLRVVAPLSHSERFILEVLDGYRLVDEKAALVDPK